MKRLAILGAGGHAGVLLDIAELTGWGQIDIFDDAAKSNELEPGKPIVGGNDDLIARVGVYDGCIVAIGNNQVRETMQRRLEAAGAIMVNLIHPTVTISKRATMGTGCALLAGCYVLNNASLGDGVIVNTGTSVDHDVKVGHFSHLSAGVFTGGGSQIGERSFIGIGSCTKHGVWIGDDVLVGAGAVVVKNVPNGLVMVGNPAKPLVNEKNDKGSQ